ncbi:hypothetical protein BCAR13_1430002 [Paraburkholderia caribensis]|nr:hypothetical protein BCAR13_1430002 [Paraburkholderia caribensis]
MPVNCLTAVDGPLSPKAVQRTERALTEKTAQSSQFFVPFADTTVVILRNHVAQASTR